MRESTKSRCSPPPIDTRESRGDSSALPASWDRIGYLMAGDRVELIEEENGVVFLSWLRPRAIERISLLTAPIRLDVSTDRSFALDSDSGNFDTVLDSVPSYAFDSLRCRFHSRSCFQDKQSEQRIISCKPIKCFICPEFVVQFRCDDLSKQGQRAAGAVTYRTEHYPLRLTSPRLLRRRERQAIEWHPLNIRGLEKLEIVIWRSGALVLYPIYCCFTISDEDEEKLYSMALLVLPCIMTVLPIRKVASQGKSKSCSFSRIEVAEAFYAIVPSDVQYPVAKKDAQSSQKGFYFQSYVATVVPEKDKLLEIVNIKMSTWGTDPPPNRNGLLEPRARTATHNKTRRRPVVATRGKLKYYRRKKTRPSKAGHSRNNCVVNKQLQPQQSDPSNTITFTLATRRHSSLHHLIDHKHPGNSSGNDIKKIQTVTSTRVSEILKLPADARPTILRDVRSCSDWYVKGDRRPSVDSHTLSQIDMLRYDYRINFCTQKQEIAKEKELNSSETEETHSPMRTEINDTFIKRKRSRKIKSAVLGRARNLVPTTKLDVDDQTYQINGAIACGICGRRRRDARAPSRDESLSNIPRASIKSGDARAPLVLA
ncbi:hypothetical protein EVAR_46_1 [Eumeta japonica]|uniref:Uncharacterized protein n=1 Tax=Eumeta variegata TaxID=151549 RepID=A0A4C1S7R7_EUMVA|nr:hypothetical protein EVAR_46_1 [Eumeta japonica]